MKTLFTSAALAVFLCANATAQEAAQVIQASAELDPLSHEVHEGLVYTIMEAELGPDPAWADDSLEPQGDGEAEIVEYDSLETEIEVTAYAESEVEETGPYTAE